MEILAVLPFLESKGQSGVVANKSSPTLSNWQWPLDDTLIYVPNDLSEL